MEERSTEITLDQSNLPLRRWKKKAEAGGGREERRGTDEDEGGTAESGGEEGERGGEGEENMEAEGV